jgi:ATP-dependent DNA helicase RecQ
VLRGERRVEMRRAVTETSVAPRRKAKPAPVDLPAADAVLLERLKVWRLNEARNQSVPAYVIFHDRTLAAIAALRPATRDALAGIHGIGAHKTERYADALLALVNDAPPAGEVQTTA